MLEGKDKTGYVWLQDLRYDDYYYLKDFEHLIVTRVNDYSSSLPRQHWEAIVYEDESCSKIVGRQECKTKEEAQSYLERFVEIALRNRRKTA